MLASGRPLCVAVCIRKAEIRSRWVTVECDSRWLNDVTGAVRPVSRGRQSDASAKSLKDRRGSVRIAVCIWARREACSRATGGDHIVTFTRPVSDYRREIYVILNNYSRNDNPAIILSAGGAVVG